MRKKNRLKIKGRQQDQEDNKIIKNPRPGRCPFTVLLCKMEISVHAKWTSNDFKSTCDDQHQGCKVAPGQNKVQPFVDKVNGLQSQSFRYWKQNFSFYCFPPLVHLLSYNKCTPWSKVVERSYIGLLYKLYNIELWLTKPPSDSVTFKPVAGVLWRFSGAWVRAMSDIQSMGTGW